MLCAMCIGDLAEDLNGFACRSSDLHDSAGFPDVYVWRRMIERVDPHLEAAHRPLRRLRPTLIGRRTCRDQPNNSLTIRANRRAAVATSSQIWPVFAVRTRFEAPADSVGTERSTRLNCADFLRKFGRGERI